MTEITASLAASLKKDLENHPVYAAIRTLDDLKLFMQHHVYSVWDFMSLVKYLQSVIAPATYPWVPVGDGSVRRFINELVLEEESDQAIAGGHYASHFELYLQAMEEIGADTTIPRQFVRDIIHHGLEQAFQQNTLPGPSSQFSRQTFAFIESGKPHVVASALAFGREHVIPMMFREMLDKSGVSRQDAPVFSFYLERHIDLDEGSHAPLSLRLLNGLCDSDSSKVEESIAAAEIAIQARKQLWDGVLECIESNQARAA